MTASCVASGDNTAVTHDVMTGSLCHAPGPGGVTVALSGVTSGRRTGDRSYLGTSAEILPTLCTFETNNQFCKICAWEIWIIIRGRECIFYIVDKL